MYWGIPTAIPLIALVSYSAILFITIRQDIERTVNRFFALYLLSMLVWSFGAFMMYINPPNAVLWNKVMLSGLVGMPLAFFGFIRAFLRVRGRAWWLYLGFFFSIVLLVINALGYLAEHVHVTEEGLIRYQFGPVAPLLGAYFVFLIGFSVLNLFRGYRQTRDSIERNRIKYALLGISAIVLGTATNVAPTLGAYPLDIAANIINALLLAYAISRYQLLDISVVVRRGVLYSIPTIIISVGYLLTVFLAVNLFHNVAGYEILLLSVVVAAVIAVASQPLRDKLQDGVDKLFFREKHNASLMLQKLSQTATAVLDLDILTDMILDEIAATMHPTKSAFVLPGAEGGRFVIVNQRGLDQVSMDLGQEHPLVQWLASHKTTLTWKEADVLPQFRALWTEEREALAKIEPELFVPLLSRAGLIGILVLGAKRADIPYSLDEQRTLSTLANQTAIAIENARFHREIRRRAEEMAGLYNIGLAITSQLNLDTLLHSIVSQAVELLGGTMGGLYLYRPERDVLEWATAVGPHPATVGTIIRRSEGLSGKVWETGQPLIVDDYQHWEGRAAVYNGQPYAAVVGVPVCWGEEFLGVLNVNVLAGTPRTFSPADADLLNLFATQAAIAIKNARLYEAAQQELSERQRVEGELRESEQRYRSLVETAADVIFTISVDGRLTSLNHAFTTITGWSRAEWLDKPFAPIVHPDDLPVSVELFQRVLQGETPPIFELRLLAKSGEYLVGQFAVTPQFQDGKVISILGIARDVTERKRLEQRIVERTRELATLYDVTAVASESLDLQVTLQRSLARVLEALRCPAGAIQLLDKAERVVRLAVQQGISPQLAAQLDTVPVDSGLLDWMLEHGEPVLITDVASDPRAPLAVSASGFQVYVCAPMRCRGQVLGVFSIFGGTEQQFHLEDVALLASIADHTGVAVENTQLHRQAEQAAALQERERLARELHDSVTQSLFSLTLFTEAAREMARKGELGSIDQHLSEVDTIAHQSLKDMRLLLYELRPSALAEEGLVGALRRRLEAVEKRLGIEARVLTDVLVELPAPVEECLYHIAQEALNNALKHAEATAVTVYLRTEGEHVILEVSDNGLGFAPDGVSDQGGMGLKSMRQRAEKLGGICTVLAQPGQGTRVQVNLPLAN